jgi:D-alanyl-D-alanine carboxypeptidase
MKWQVVLLTLLVLVSAIFVAVKFPFGENGEPAGDSGNDQVKTSVSGWDSQISKVPERDWKILDPETVSQAVVVQSLDDNFPFFKQGSYKSWPLASVTKLITAIVAIESVGMDKKATVTEEVMKTAGEAGDLRAGEVYTVRDLLKIMLMMSSNRAAAALEYHVGHDEFVKMMTEKIRAIGMTQTVVYDASGLDDRNEGTASDILLLLNYILERDPEILNYTRLASLLVQPTNSERSHTVTNIDPLSDRADFLGGKTGTSAAARQNLAAILSFKGRRVAVIVLGSADRFKEVDDLFAWVEKAYKF